MALGAFGIITTEFGVIGILPMVAKEFHISIDTAGWLLSGFALTIALTGPFTTLFTAHINRRTMMSLVLLLFFLSNIMSGLSPDFTTLMIARIFPALLHPVFWSVATVAAAKQVAPKDAPKAVAVVLAGLSTATVLGVPLTTYVAGLLNWRYSFIVSGIINLVAFIALATLVPSMPVKERASIKGQLVVFQNKQLWIALFSMLIMAAGMFATYGFLAEYLGKISHMNDAEISLMLLLFGGAGIAGNWVAGIALSRNIILTTRIFLLSMIIIHLLAYTFAGLFLPMAVIISTWGFIHTAGFLIGQTRTTIAAPEAPELATSLMVSFGNGGVMLGTFLGGYMIRTQGTQAVIWMSIILLTVCFVLSFAGNPVRSPKPVDALGAAC